MAIRELRIPFVVLGALIGLLGGPVPHSAAAPPTVELGSATDFAVLAGSKVASAGSSVIQGDLGVGRATKVAGFPPGHVLNGAVHTADRAARLALRDARSAFTAAARLPRTSLVRVDLAGQTLAPGVHSGRSLTLSGTVVLDAKGDPDAIFVFRSAATLVTTAGARVSLVNGARSCNVFWQVATSADIGAGTAFVGTVLARTSISAGNEAVIEGRLMALKGTVALDTNTFTRPDCRSRPVVTPTSATPVASPVSSDAPTTTLPALTLAAHQATAVVPKKSVAGGLAPPWTGGHGHWLAVTVGGAAAMGVTTVLAIGRSRRRRP